MYCVRLHCMSYILCVGSGYSTGTDNSQLAAPFRERIGKRPDDRAYPGSTSTSSLERLWSRPLSDAPHTHMRMVLVTSKREAAGCEQELKQDGTASGERKGMSHTELC